MRFWTCANFKRPEFYCLELHGDQIKRGKLGDRFSQLMLSVWPLALHYFGAAAVSLEAAHSFAQGHHHMVLLMA